MKKVSENYLIICELFEAWAEEVSESFFDFNYSAQSDYVGVGIIDSDTICYKDIHILDKDLRANGFNISMIGNNEDKQIEIWIHATPDYE